MRLVLWTTEQCHTQVRVSVSLDDGIISFRQTCLSLSGALHLYKYSTCDNNNYHDGE